MKADLQLSFRRHSHEEIELQIHVLRKYLKCAGTAINHRQTKYMVARAHVMRSIKELEDAVLTERRMAPLRAGELRLALLEQYEFDNDEINEVIDVTINDIDPDALTVVRLRNALSRNVELVGIPLGELLPGRKNDEWIKALSADGVTTLGGFALNAYGMPWQHLNRAMKGIAATVGFARRLMERSGELTVDGFERHEDYENPA